MTTCINDSVRCTHLARQTHDGAEVSSVCLLCTHGTRRALGQHDVWPRRVRQHVHDSTAKTHSIRHALSGAFIRTNDRSNRPYAVYSICTCVIRVTFVYKGHIFRRTGSIVITDSTTWTGFMSHDLGFDLRDMMGFERAQMSGRTLSVGMLIKSQQCHIPSDGRCI